jgi:hypothetical protein
MTEHQWWHGRDPDAMIDWLFYDLRAATRKFRLFWVAACRELLPLVPDYPELGELLGLIEQSAGWNDRDPGVSKLKVAAYNRVVDRNGPYESSNPEWNAYLAIVLADERYSSWLDPRSRSRGNELGEDPREPGPTPRAVTRYCTLADSFLPAAHDVTLLHEIFGPLPLRDIAADPAWLTTDVQLLARGIYDEKAFDRMPILADALQDAGCSNEEVLRHCRQKPHRTEHVRGCWVIDLLLGQPWKSEVSERGA